MAKIILLNKPFGVLTQFTPADGHASLKDYIPIQDVYPAGRLDADSEGLVVLTDDGALQARISHPRHKMMKTYWAQVDGVPTDEALAQMASGVDLGDFKTAPCKVQRIDEPKNLWPRDPPIRYRATLPTSWIQIGLKEGKNRQVRRMTAKIGFPTLRLIRWAIGAWTLADLPVGEWRQIVVERVPEIDVTNRHKRKRS